MFCNLWRYEFYDMTIYHLLTGEVIWKRTFSPIMELSNIHHWFLRIVLMHPNMFSKEDKSLNSSHNIEVVHLGVNGPKCHKKIILQPIDICGIYKSVTRKQAEPRIVKKHLSVQVIRKYESVYFCISVGSFFLYYYFSFC